MNPAQNLPYHCPLHKPLSNIPMPVRVRAADEVVRSWRRLTGGRRVRDRERRTLIGCSGGADSSALVLALARVCKSVVVGHIVHDLRPREAALADARAVSELADRLGVPFVESEVSVREGPGNAEARARAARYRALDQLASAAECPFVAVAHHQGDQAETLLMALMRGCGPRGLAGMPESRPLASATLIRPMLAISGADARGICEAGGWAWREDATNADTTRLRAAVRHGLLPALERLRPDAATRIARSATVLRDASAILEERVELVWLAGRHDLPAGRAEWDRAVLKRERPAVLGDLLRRASRRLVQSRSLDRMGSRTLGPLVRAIVDEEVRPREFTVGSVRVYVRSRAVSVQGECDG
jgi:tRNA(Ile)-lysidine synthetase-like protein